MTVTLTYEAVPSPRVRINADTLTALASGKVERSTDQVAWNTVRGGAQVPLTGGSLVLPGTSGNYASTPDNAALDITGDVDLRADVTMANWSAAAVTFVAKWTATGSQQSYLLDTFNDTGKLRIFWSNNGSAVNSLVSTVAVTPSSTGRLAVRVTFDVDNGASGKTATFYTAATMAGPWTQLGAPVVEAGTTSIFSSTAILEVGSFSVGTGDPLPGTVHAAEVRSGIGGTVVAVPNFEFLAAGTTSFTDGAGRVWTLNGTASVPTRQFVAPVDDYEFVPGVVNFYRVGTDLIGLLLPGVSYSNATTPDNAALDITGDLDLRAEVTLAAGVWSSTVVTFLAKWTSTGNQKSYLLDTDGAGRLRIFWSTTGSDAPNLISTTVVKPPLSGHLAVRATLDVNNGVSGKTAVFYTAPTIAGPWTQLGNPVVSGTTTSVFASTAILEVGSFDTGTADLLPGTVHAVEVRNGMNGTVVANPNFAVQPFGTTGFTDGAGRVWTVNRALIVNYVTASTTPSLDRIWLKATSPSLNQPITVADWSNVERPARSVTFDVIGSRYPVAVTDVRQAKQWTLDILVMTKAERDAIEAILANGHVFLIQVPHDRDVPGGYVTVATSSERRRGKGHPLRILSLPLIEAAPAGPDVIGP